MKKNDKDKSVEAKLEFKVLNPSCVKKDKKTNGLMQDSPC